MTKYVLSLDGGGIRGAATAAFLAGLERNLGTSLYDKFDMFVGTSAGGIIACALGVLQMSGQQLASIFNYENGNEIMNKSVWDRIAGLKQAEPKYDGKGKRRVLERYFGAALLTQAKKPTLVVTYDVERRVSAVLKSCSKTPISAVDATDATSAAPLYFPTVRVGQRWLIDGGVIANNPALCAYAEARRMWPDENDIVVLSVGTGMLIRKIPGEKSAGFGFLGWITHDLLGVVMDESVVDYQARTLLGDKYVRVTSRLETAKDDLDDCSRGNLEELRRLGEYWWAHFGEVTLRLLK